MRSRHYQRERAYDAGLRLPQRIIETARLVEVGLVRIVKLIHSSEWHRRFSKAYLEMEMWSVASPNLITCLLMPDHSRSFVFGRKPFTLSLIHISEPTRPY